MSQFYKTVGWNRQKRIYDGLLWLSLLAYLVAFGVIGRYTNPNITAETLIIRALGTAALLLLHLDGCVTCPWHGYQYLPESGQSPPPFEEKISTYRLMLLDRKLLIDPRALPPGARVEPARLPDLERADPEEADREEAEETVARRAPQQPGEQE